MSELKQTAPSNQRDTLAEVENLDKSNSSNGSYKNTLEHVKGTLTMYLKKVPIIDVNNEMLLKILYSMMNFSKDEIQRLQETREELPVYKIDSNKTKSKQQAVKREVSQRNSSNQNSYENDEKYSQRSEGLQRRSIGHAPDSPSAYKEKVGKGILGMFSRKESSKKDANSVRPRTSQAFNYVGEDNQTNSFRSR